MLGHRPFIDDVSGKGEEAYLAPGNDAALVIADGAAGQQVEAVAGPIRPLLSMLPAVALRSFCARRVPAFLRSPPVIRFTSRPWISAPFGPNRPSAWAR